MDAGYQQSADFTLARLIDAFVGLGILDDALAAATAAAAERAGAAVSASHRP